MSIKIREWFGFDVEDRSDAAARARAAQACPFLGAPCDKTFHDGTVSGVCAISSAKGEPVAVCPKRLYARDHALLGEVAALAFGPGRTIVHPRRAREVRHDGSMVVPFGKGYGSEVKLPRLKGAGNYFVDWVLARIAPDGSLAEFVAVEVQTIDTTGSYKPEVEALRAGARTAATSQAGFNWENVNKRILPQLIYKGHVLRGERLCQKGLFFVCPSEVYQRIVARLGGQLREYKNLQPGSITFCPYGFGPPVEAGQRALAAREPFSTTVDQVALAFTAPINLPAAGVYQQAIEAALGKP